MTDVHPDELTLLKRDELPEWFSADTKRLISYAAAADIRWGIAASTVQTAWLNARNAAEHDAIQWVGERDFRLLRGARGTGDWIVTDGWRQPHVYGSAPTPLLAIVAAREAGK